MNLVRAELLKIRTTPTWWVIGLVMFALWGMNMGLKYMLTDGTPIDPDVAAANPDLAAMSVPTAIAADMYTAGQYFGVLMVMILGALVVTNEFQHQTATTTFLTSPRRTEVILAKLTAATLFGVVAWAVTTVLNLIAGSLILRGVDLPVLLGEADIWQAIGFNALAYAVWAILGVGAGVLLRSQIGTTITVTVVYLAGSVLVGGLWFVLAEKFGAWFDKLQVLVPTQASQLMVAGIDLPGSPDRWVGAAVLLGYALVTGVIGTMIIRRRDIA